MQFCRFSIHSHRASSRTSGLLREGCAAKSNVSRLLICEGEANAAFDVAPLAIDALQFAQSKQIARIVGAILG
jgi:hypothetical protein